MTFSLTMPALGESVTEGTVTRWLKKEGDQIAIDEPFQLPLAPQLLRCQHLANQ